ncbi:cell wall hydrolase [Novispirillum sp. DQ9]|uniref:cell wall hydrolase n=1 Tax=Novispirillum sp. DQ9 TaxID=3398612 RepID=UPI003C7D86DB
MMKALWAAAFALLIWAPIPTASATGPALPEDVTIDVASLPGGRDALMCLALNDYWEARGESLAGRVAVAHVVLNRVADPRYPGSVCDVVHQHMVPDQPRACQFSWTCDGRADDPTDTAAWQRSLRLAAAILDADSAVDDPTGGALWYHAASVRPVWSGQLVEATVIGAHTFYRDPPVPPLPLPRPEEVLVAMADDVTATVALAPVAVDMVEGVVVTASLRRWSTALNGSLQQVAALQ